MRETLRHQQYTRLAKQFFSAAVNFLEIVDRVEGERWDATQVCNSCGSISG